MGRLVEGIRSRRCPADKMGCRGRPADVISCRGARLTRWVARGVRPTRCVVGGFHRIPRNTHQDPEVVTETVQGWSMPTGCWEIHDGIER